ncbi:type II secretion system F family protein [Cohnella caldifontis]|uniref:type II secretion system F family protein n=1 Tax=Cohnella caldifontis TaxID=3027471 RepID=UPI0023ED00AB|nr:type II secretion system F family protein [Cohnella sp. YIM B05605]
MTGEVLLSWCVLLFLLAYVSLRFGFSAVWDRMSLRRRLSARAGYGREPERGHRRWRRFGKLHSHAADLMAAVGWNVNPGPFYAASVFLGLVGVSAGMALFRTPRSAALLGAMMGLLPYVLLRMRLVSRQLAVRLEFLPAVELFYQCYLLTGGRQIRTALQKTVEERRLPGEVQAVFDQLARHLSLREDDEESLRRFCLAFGHTWADHFASILKVALTEGNPIAPNLKELIDDMRKAQLANQQERHRLLEIRLANFTPALFLGLFLAINFRMSPEGSYRYYVLDPTGRGMLLNALALMFGSFIMGIYLSRRKM